MRDFKISSVNINASRTNGNRAFVDNQSTFVVGEGSNLHVGTVENTGAVIGKEGNSTFKIDSYVGKDIQNYDTMTTTGGSIGASLGGNPKINNVGFNQDSRDKQGITRNTVIGDVEITKAEGSPINRDLGKANEITKDTHRSTNINVESQTIEYATNPAKLKEDIGKAKKEISDVTTAIKESIHDRGDDNRNFFGQLSEVRLSKTIDNITHERLKDKKSHDEIADTFKDAYKDLGYDINIIFSDPKNSPQLLDEKGKPKTGTAYVDDYGVKTIIINAQDSKNMTKAGLIGTIVEEGSHVIGKVEGRQRKTGTDEKGLESTGRASNEYFSEKYKDDNPAINIQSDGKDYSNVDFGENVGDIAPAIAIGAGIIIVYIAGTYTVQQNGKTIGTYPDSKTAQKNTQYLLDGIGSGLKWVWNGGAWVVEQGGRIFGKGSTKNNRKSNPDQVKSSQEKYEEAKKEFDDLNKKPNKSKEDNEKLKDLKKQKEHWRKKAQEESEIHARKAQGGKNQGGGNSRGR